MWRSSWKTRRRGYWTRQVVLPMVVTVVLSYLWLFVLLNYPSELQPSFAARGVAQMLPLVVLERGRAARLQRPTRAVGTV